MKIVAKAVCVIRNHKLCHLWLSKMNVMTLIFQPPRPIQLLFLGVKKKPFLNFIFHSFNIAMYQPPI